MPTSEDDAQRYWIDWVRREIGGSQLAQDAAWNAALQEIRQGRDSAGAAAAAVRMAESLGVVPKNHQGRPLACRLCGATPAADVTIREHNGRIVWMVFKRQRGPFCRDCGLALFRDHQNSTLYQGWFGLISFFITPLTLLSNLFAWWRLQALPPPTRDPNAKSAIPSPLNPGKPLFFRAGPYIAAVLLGVLGLLYLKPGSSSPNTLPTMPSPPYTSTTASPSATPLAPSMTPVPPGDIPFPRTGNAFVFVSQPGNFIGQGKTETLIEPTWSFSAAHGVSPGDITIEVRSGQGIGLIDWTVELAAPGDSPMQVGPYADAMRAAFRTNGLPGMDVYGEGRGCNQVFGTFTVSQIVYGADGAIKAFEATFIEHCESAGAPAMSGHIRFSTP